MNVDMALAHMRAQMEQVVEADMEAVQVSRPFATSILSLQCQRSDSLYH